MKKTAPTPVIVNIFGWVGVVLVLAAYALLSLGVIGAGYIFQVMTLVGSLAVAIQSSLKLDKQPAVLNFTFSFIALIAIIRLLSLR